MTPALFSLIYEPDPQPAILLPEKERREGFDLRDELLTTESKILSLNALERTSRRGRYFLYFEEQQVDVFLDCEELKDCIGVDAKCRKKYNLGKNEFYDSIKLARAIPEPWIEEGREHITREMALLIGRMKRLPVEWIRRVVWTYILEKRCAFLMVRQIVVALAKALDELEEPPTAEWVRKVIEDASQDVALTLQQGLELLNKKIKDVRKRSAELVEMRKKAGPAELLDLDAELTALRVSWAELQDEMNQLLSEVVPGPEQPAGEESGPEETAEADAGIPNLGKTGPEGPQEEQRAQAGAEEQKEAAEPASEAAEQAAEVAEQAAEPASEAAEQAAEAAEPVAEPAPTRTTRVYTRPQQGVSISYLPVLVALQTFGARGDVEVGLFRAINGQPAESVEEMLLGAYEHLLRSGVPQELAGYWMALLTSGEWERIGRFALWVGEQVSPNGLPAFLKHMRDTGNLRLDEMPPGLREVVEACIKKDEESDWMLRFIKKQRLRDERTALAGTGQT